MSSHVYPGKRGQAISRQIPLLCRFYAASISPDTQPLALTIGNFDGVHLGHQALLNELHAVTQARGLQTAVVIFEPHPREFFTPQQAPTRLTNLREKLELFMSIMPHRLGGYMNAVDDGTWAERRRDCAVVLAVHKKNG